MKSYTSKNITLERVGNYESSGWFLRAHDPFAFGGNVMAVEDKEIPLIKDVCERWMKDRSATVTIKKRINSKKAIVTFNKKQMEKGSFCLRCGRDKKITLGL
uniref:Uncharacterized protein n=1 Tax=viral metagenome TaxID=1070528 RepID=A0A6M3XSS9_9ZZZZ